MTVAVPLDANAAEILILQASRLARRLNVGWNVLLVQCRESRLEKLEAEQREQLRASLELAMNLGGYVVMNEGTDIAGTIVDFAKHEQVELLLIGKRRRRPLLRRLIPGTVDRILAAARGFDVLVVDTADGVPA